MEPSRLSAGSRGHPQRPRYGQTLVQNGALRAVSCQARAPTETLVWAVSCQARAPTETPVWAVSRQARATETPVRTDTCTEWSPLGCQPSGEGTHKDPGTDRHLFRMEPSGLSAVRRGHPQRPRYGQTLVQNGALRAVSCRARAPTETPVWAVRRGHPERPRYGLSAVRRGPQRPRYGQTLVQNGALWAVSLQARAPTETLVRTDTCIEWSPLGFQPSGEGHRDPGTDRHLYRMELSAVRRGHPQRPRYGL
ncbi:hypothetical protein NDU88_006677 [Pleurodeles waltl]|uniref:Uncharacterized protein n=1 Tax=Pleurodeles waltl TaxID=8319 RepID=A0AAV7L4G9_PLEWA|nr:hypothetical protein NDU88_006677 [Pleurodeles waltl]